MKICGKCGFRNYVVKYIKDEPRCSSCDDKLSIGSIGEPHGERIFGGFMTTAPVLDADHQSELDHRKRVTSNEA